MRASYPFDQDPGLPADFEDVEQTSFGIQRARIKVGGHGYKPWLKYCFEYAWASNRLMGWRDMVERFEWLQLQVGQWKVNYNRERVDSSGKQQFFELSIVNRESPLTGNEASCSMDIFFHTRLPICVTSPGFFQD